MSDLKIDADNEMVISNGDLVLLTPNESIDQLLRQRLNFLYGEWFLDSSKGVPYFQDILVKSASFEAVDAIFKRTILETPGIDELLKFTFAYENSNRNLTLSFMARKTTGEVINFNEVVGA